MKSLAIDVAVFAALLTVLPLFLLCITLASLTVKGTEIAVGWVRKGGFRLGSK